MREVFHFFGVMTVYILMIVDDNLSRARLQRFAILWLAGAVLLALAQSYVVCVVAVLIAVATFKDAKNQAK